MEAYSSCLFHLLSISLENINGVFLPVCYHLYIILTVLVLSPVNHVSGFLAWLISKSQGRNLPISNACEQVNWYPDHKPSKLSTILSHLPRFFSSTRHVNPAKTPLVCNIKLCNTIGQLYDDIIHMCTCFHPTTVLALLNVLNVCCLAHSDSTKSYTTVFYMFKM